MEDNKNKWILWVGLAIPVVALMFVAILAYMPSNLNANYDFLYYSRGYYNNYSYRYCNHGEVYVVKDQKVSLFDFDKTLPDEDKCEYDIQSDPPKIYRYSVSTGERSQLSLAEAQKLKVDNNPISPDNISIQLGDNYDNGILDIFGGGRRYDLIFLKNTEGGQKKIDLGLTNSYDFIFIGWVLK